MMRRFTLMLALLLLPACENAVDPWAAQIDTRNCQRVTLSNTAGVVTVPPSEEPDICFRIPAGDRSYVLAFADTRFIEKARTGPEMPVGGTREIFFMSLRGAKRNIVPRTSKLAFEEAGGFPADFRLEPPSISACLQGSIHFCRETPWKVGDAITSPDGAAFRVMIVAAQLVLAFPGTAYDSMSDTVKQHYAEVAAALVRTHLPLFASVFSGLPVTSAGSQQTLIFMGLAKGAGFATVGIDGTAVRGFVQCAFNAVSVDQGASLFLIGHELTHLAQMKWTWELDPARRVALVAQGRGYLGAPFWAGEGVANFISAEGLRIESGVPWGNNMSLIGLPSRSVIGNYGLMLKDGAGDIASGYGSAARYMRSLAEVLVSSGVLVATSVREVARGTVEGWFGIDDIGFKSVGLSSRMSEALKTSFDPAESLLTFTMRNALDDVDPQSQWNITSTLEAWRSFPPNYSATASADSAAIEFGAGEGGTGYVTIKADAEERVIRISSPVKGMRWMVAGF